ncbi:MAG: hypothetical protein DHS20C16_15590 [Phycisphaerae bacterium]|nr:MAG: hypothetical protein DHS20C16_15590 [Phycisphaerae bacterium]
MLKHNRAYGLSTHFSINKAGSERSDARRSGRMFMSVLAFILIGLTAVASADPAAHFELRLGASESDSVVNVGDALELEVWVEVTDPPANAMMTSFAFFLNADTTDVITFNEDFNPDPEFTGWQALDSGLDNLPDTGDFDRAYFTFLTPTTAGIGAPTRLGTYTVTGLNVGLVGFDFAIQIPQRLWSLGITGEILQGPQVTGSIAAEVATIEVVSNPVARSADADGDCDIDLRDYYEMQICVPEDGEMLSTNGCELLDLNDDSVIDGQDTNMLVEQITGAMPWPGDLDIDGDVDLADYGQFQICMTEFGQPGFEEFCKFADVNRDTDLTETDYLKFHDRLVGPQ